MAPLKDPGADVAQKAGVHEFKPATRAVHADDPMNFYTDVAPAMHVSTTFRYSSDPDALQPASDESVRRRARRLSRLQKR
jgi:cystathionine beta-lyase/cystathionine gamma-synthase